MNLEKSDEELEKYNIRSFLNENEIQERNNLLDEIKSLDYHIHKIKKLINKLEEKRDSLIQRRIRLNIKLKQRDVNFSQYVLDNFNEDELIKILDAFLEYKDYFENPPKEAYEMDKMEYSECKEAHEMECLLFKYNIFDTQYKDKLEIMEKKYYKVQPDEFSKEKLSLDELFAVLTWINRGEHHCGAFYNEAIKKNTFYNLLKRMEEIRNELRNSS